MKGLNAKIYRKLISPSTHIMRIIQQIAAITIFLMSSSLMADMYVDRSIVIFEPDTQPRQDIKVSNSSEDVMYVQVEVFEVVNPGEATEERIKLTDPKKIKLIATPTKLVIPAGGQKLVRIVNLDKNNDQERVYRINITPIVAPLEEEESQLRIIVAYQVLAIVQPMNPESTLEVERNGKKIIFKNNGTTNILLSEGRQCPTQSSDECQELASRRLYAGNTWKLDLPLDAPVAYSVRSFDGIKKQVFQ